MSKLSKAQERQNVARAVVGEKFSPPQQFLVQEQLQITSGPLPSPDVLARYVEVLPDAAERVFRMAEKEQNHAHWIARFGVISQVVGMAAGFVLILTGMLGGLWLVYKDKPLQGFTAFFAGLAVLGGGYWMQRKTAIKSRPANRGDLPPPA